MRETSISTPEDQRPGTGAGHSGVSGALERARPSTATHFAQEPSVSGTLRTIPPATRIGDRPYFRAPGGSVSAASTVFSRARRSGNCWKRRSYRSAQETIIKAP